ncbi:ras association domain-containing protein 5-like isoform X3 [Actinia tenebrosa]|nr:ras association domain-containing protein 5-like isoform X3 [Actinia tenebrosa]
MSIDEVSMKTLHLLEQSDQKRNEPYLMISTNISHGSLRRKIGEFNTQTTGLIMTMKDETIFQGFVRVHMNLLRPVNVVAGERPLSILENVGNSVDSKRSRTSFFLPLGTVKALHVKSDTTVQEVIEALLKKYKIADNPRKFALFESYQEQDNHVILRRMSDVEKPLMLRLLWGGADIKHSFSLQENETGDIVWEVFSTPELENFVKILEKEEEEHIAMVREKYRIFKEKLQQEMKELGILVPTDEKATSKSTNNKDDSTESAA